MEIPRTPSRHGPAPGADLTGNHPQAPQPGPSGPPPATPSAPRPAAADAAGAPGDAVPPLAADTRPRRRGIRLGDTLFFNASRGSGILLLVIMAAIAVFLIYRAVNAISADHGNFITTFEWSPDLTPPHFGIAVLAFGTLISSAIAMLIAVPIALGIALFISHYAPRRLAQPLAYLIDLLAAVPSIVFGLWGALFLAPHMLGINTWLNQYLGWTYIFHQQSPGSAPRSLFTVSIVLAIMILPIVTAVSREVFRQVPKTHEEAALALGATRWEVIRTAVLPFGRSGVISAAMLGLGRALGETMAVAVVLSPSFLLSGHLTDPGGGTIAQNIASQFNEAGPMGRDALIASGMVLFVITLLVNGAARLIIARRKEYSGANA